MKTFGSGPVLKDACRWLRDDAHPRGQVKMIWTPTGLRQAFVLAFIHLGTRRVICSPCSFKPDAKWMINQAHVFIEQAREADLRIEYLVRDRDATFCTLRMDRYFEFVRFLNSH